MELCEVIYCYLKKQPEDTSCSSSGNDTLNEKQLSGLQYIGGFVLHKLHKKLKNSSKWKTKSSQEALSLLCAGKSTSKIQNTTLTSALSRGGLWEVSHDIEKILIIAEKHFNLKITINTRKMEISAMACSVSKFTDVLELFKEVIENSEIPISSSVAKDTLFQIIYMYFKVRSFSYAKDVTQKAMVKKGKRNEKGLRTELKRISAIKKVCK